MELILNDPVALPWPSGDGVQAMFWVRIYRDPHSAVVIIADVPANPGPWPDTVDTQIARQLSRDYLPGDLQVRWFMCYPGKFLSGQPSRTRYYEAGFDGDSRTYPRGAGEIPRSEISVAIGRPLQLMPAHDEVLDRVFAAGGSLHPGVRPVRFVVLQARSIPPPGIPARCAHWERYRQFLRGKGWDPASPARIPANVREEFFSQLTQADFQACAYHRADWRAIAAEAVRIVRTMGEYLKQWNVEQALKDTSLSDSDRHWLLSLLSYPLNWSGNDFTDGQHRGCALRHCGAPQIVRGSYGPPGPAGTWRIADDA